MWRQSVEDSGALRHDANAIISSSTATALGLHIDGIAGLARVPPAQILELLRLTVHVGHLPAPSRLSVQVLVGRWLRVPALRRERMVAFQSVFRELGESTWNHLPMSARLEFKTAIALVPIPCMDWRLPLPKSGCGVCRSTALILDGARILPELARTALPHSSSVGLVEAFAGVGGLRRSLEFKGIHPEITIVCKILPETSRVILQNYSDLIDWGMRVQSRQNESLHCSLNSQVSSVGLLAVDLNANHAPS